MRLRSSLVLLGMLAGGCGFHLEGSAPLPSALKTPYVDAKDRQSDFVQDLRKALLINGARLTDASTDASATVHVTKDELTRRVLSVSSTNQPREYELTYTVSFSVSAAAAPARSRARAGRARGGDSRLVLG